MSFVTKGTTRRVLWSALAVLLCLVVVVALPPVQTRLARAVLSRLDGVDVRLDHLTLGLSGVTVEGLRVAAPGVEASVERADVELGFWSSLARFGLDVERVRIDGVDVRVVPVPGEKPAQTAGPREPSAGVRSRLPAGSPCNHPRTSRSRDRGSSRSTPSARARRLRCGSRRAPRRAATARPSRRARS